MNRGPGRVLRQTLSGLLRRASAAPPDGAEAVEREMVEVGEVPSGVAALAGAARATLGSDPEGADELLGLLEREAAGMLGRLQVRYAALAEARGALAARGTA